MRFLLRNSLILSTLLLVIAAGSAAAATFTVTNINDSGTGSLRQAILDANTAAGDDIIAFDASFNVPQTITLGGTVMTITGSGALTLNGPGRDLLTISGNLASRIFEVSNVTPATLGTVTFNNMTIANGFAVASGDGTGAGIGINNGASSPAATFVPVVIDNVMFKNNRGGVNPGGGIGCARSGSITANNSSFTGNAANGGGAISTGTGIGQCSVTVTNSSFYANQPNSSGATATTITFGGNPGTAVYSITGSSFYNNGNGSGNYTALMQSTATNSTITNTTFANNHNVGATIALSLGTATMTNVTISRNTAASDNVPAGISLSNGAIANLANTILAGNTSPSGENNINSSAGFVSQGYNIIGNNLAPQVIAGDTTGNQLGVDPRLDAVPRNNGGTTFTLALRGTSPAIDAGHPTTFPAIDQRGIARAQDGDSNGNARSDIGAFERRGSIDNVPSGLAADYDGDRKTDASVYRPSNNAWYLLRSTDGFAAYQFGATGDSVVPADYTGDGKTDVAIWRPSNGTWYILRSEDLTVTGGPFGTVGDTAAPGDYDGDGKADLAVYRPGALSTFYVQESTNGFVAFSFGVAEDKPTLGDFDGDGKTDFAVYRPSQGAWYRFNSSNNAFYAVQFGQAGDKVVPADYTGDGKTDVAVWRESTGTWYVLKSEDLQTVTGGGFGSPGDIPTPGDFDGDGKTDFAVYRPGAQGVFYTLQTTNGFTVIPWGLAGDIPTPNAYVK